LSCSRPRGEWFAFVHGEKSYHAKDL
jgi:hypothetical protein